MLNATLPPRLDAAGIEAALVTISTMDRAALCEQLRAYPATFPLDFTDAFLDTQSTDRLRHIVARMVMHCRVALVEFARAA